MQFQLYKRVCPILLARNIQPQILTSLVENDEWTRRLLKVCLS